MESFITEIKVNEVRNIKDLTIPLSEHERKHLIITGKNGSGKTSLLLEMNKYLQYLGQSVLLEIEQTEQGLKEQKHDYATNDTSPKLVQQANIEATQRRLDQFGHARIKFSSGKKHIYNQCRQHNYLVAFFDSKRQTDFRKPVGIYKLNLDARHFKTERGSPFFLQYIVNLKAERSFAKDDDEENTVSKIDEWFNSFESRLQFIFGDTQLKLKFDRKQYNFDIITGEGDVLNFNTLPDGYSSIISIVSELLLRMEAHHSKSYNLEGVVLIDEIETHLHVDLQKKILPFLIDFFPKIQFIVTTHSPFVLSSVSNAVICDLESRLVTDDLSGYSYDALVESYFGTDKYSEEVKQKVFEFENLIDKPTHSLSEEGRLHELRNYFACVPKFMSDELVVKLQEIKLKELTKAKQA